jgi:class 3 adenylate cyclase
MGGHVAKKLGDGLMALFGYPAAQENDAERGAPPRSSVPTPTAVPVAEAVGERRHVTVMFCDLVGSTSISAGLDAERAARAALSIQRALAEANRKNTAAGKPALNARIGIEIGPVVIDAAGEIYGDAPNVAARVQALAEPGTVVVTARVQRQIAGLFVAEEHGGHALKGVPEPVTIFCGLAGADAARGNAISRRWWVAMRKSPC